TMAEPEVSADVSRPPLSDIRTLAVGFEELASKAATPPPPPPVAAVPTPVAAVAVPPSPQRIYTGDDANIIPPLAINQALPSFRGVSPVQRVGRIEVIIDVTGAV